MSEVVIQVDEVSKMYRLGVVSTGTVSHDLNRWWHRVRGKEDPYLKLGQENKRDQKGGQYSWALQGVSFEVEQGDVLGIVGKNGAGKSTLLKILSRVTAPTTGTIRAKGRIASLLEVGTGFHPELTGRENIFLNGAILGMRKHEIKRKFDEIVEFAGVERYIDTPVKRYSSGMYVRLAFAVAAHLESEILIVDEVLAVGDAEFQSKCLGKMGDISRGEGRTVLFVSHNMSAVRQLCTKAIMMKNGKVAEKGLPNEIIELYLTTNTDAERFIEWPENEGPSTAEITAKGVRIYDLNGRIDNILTTTDDLKFEIEYELKQEIKDLRVSLSIFTLDGTNVFSTSDFGFQDASRLRKKGLYKSTCFLPGSILNAGRYIARIDFEVPKIKALITGISISFTISELIYNQLGITIASKPPGVIHPYLNWEVKSFQED